MRVWPRVVSALFRSVRALFRSRTEQALVELALRQQLAVYAHRHSRPRLRPVDRAFGLALAQLWPRWKEVLIVVKPETVIRWHRQGFRPYWRWKGRVRRPGRPRIPGEVRDLIRRMARENGWGARKIQAELEKLGLPIGLATVSRYLPKRSPEPGSHQRWMTFLRTHKAGIATMDFCIVPTVRFQLLYAWLVIAHGRRRILHFDVTTPPPPHG